LLLIAGTLIVRFSLNFLCKRKNKIQGSELVVLESVQISFVLGPPMKKETCFLVAHSRNNSDRKKTQKDRQEGKKNTHT
jgi:hypothetical protein